MTSYRFVDEPKSSYRFVDKQEDEFDKRIRAEGGSGTGAQNFFAGMGKGFTDLARGAGQLVGFGPSAQETRETKARDAALLNTRGGFWGNIAGNVIPAAATSIIPGANTLTGAALTGGVLGALQPTETYGEKGLNAAVGGALGLGGKVAGDKLASFASSKLAQKTADLAVKKGQRAPLDATLKAGQEAGYVVPPSAVNPTFVGNRLESIGGKAAVGQQAAIKNQAVTDKLARDFIGLPQDAALSPGTLSQARYAAAAPYRKVASLNDRAAQLLDDWKANNLEAKLQWNYFNRSGNVDAFKAAKAADKAATTALNEIDTIAQGLGQPGLPGALKNSRVQIAKVHEVEKALNEATGSIDASAVGRAFDRGDKLTGEMRTIGAFQQAFPSYMREAAKIPTPGVSKSEALIGLLLGAGGGAGLGPAGALLGAVPLMSHPVRSALLSSPVQKALAHAPNYSPGLLYSVPPAVLKNQVVRRALPGAAAFGGLNYLGQEEPL